ncbi:MAG: aminotransferase class V-fold PLP-dependent enzyme [Candidatus Aminicenantes bacterium]|nr:aminotransferase class V-fold PLP-dependent enzyme [Candidatus Aminicenantes bacterium]
MWNGRDLNRRDFLKSCAAGVGVLAGAPHNVLECIFEAGRDRADLSPEEVASDEDFWFQVLQAFTEDRNIINLNNGTIQPGLRIVQEAVIRHSAFSGNAAAHSMAILAKEIESCRRRLAFHLGCDPEELVICRGGTEAGQIPIMGLDLKRGDLDKFYDLVVEQVTPRTKVIHVCHMTHWTGQMAPVRRLSDMAHSRGIEVLCDGAHAFMHIPFKLSDLGCDYYTASLHKWLMAPPGNGFVRIPKDRIPKIWPLTPPWSDKPNDIRRFEDVGTRTPANRVAIAEAITLSSWIGGRFHDHEHLEIKVRSRLRRGQTSARRPQRVHLAGS